MVFADDSAAANPLAELSVDEGGRKNYQVKLQTMPQGVAAVTLNIAPTDDNFMVTPPNLTFTAADSAAADYWDTYRMVTVAAAEDDDATDRTAMLEHRTHGGNYEDFTDDLAVRAIDNDTPNVEVSPMQLRVTEGSSRSYTLRLATQPSAEVEVRIMVASGDENIATVDATTVTFTPMEWRQPKTVRVSGVNNMVDDTEARITTISHSSSSTDSDYDDSTRTFTIDAVEISVVDTNAVATVISTVLPVAARVMTGHTTSAIAHRIGQARGGDVRGVTIGSASVATAVLRDAPGVADGTRRLRAALRGTKVVMPLQSAAVVKQYRRAANGRNDEAVRGRGGALAVGDATNASPSPSSPATLWGGVDYRDMAGDIAGKNGGSQLNWSGDVTSVYLGVDTRNAQGHVIGLAWSRSDSTIDYTADTERGSQQLSMMGLHPYFGWAGGWLSVGRGKGELTVTSDGAPPETSDVAMQTLGFGLSRDLRATPINQDNVPHGPTIQFSTELAHTRLTIQDNGGAISGMTAIAQQLRASFTRRNTRVVSTGLLTPSFAGGLRYDAGDGQTGVGVEFDGGLHYASAISGLTAQGNLRALVGRDDYAEWGVAGTVRLPHNSRGGA